MRDRFEGQIVYTIQEVCKATGIPLSTLYSYIRKGKIRVLKNPFGRGLFIYDEELPKLQEAAKFYREKRRRGTS